MTMSKVDVFETSVHKSNAWINEVAEKIHTDDAHLAYAALRCAMHVLRDRLTVEQAALLAAELPLVLRGVFYEGYRPATMPEKIRHRDEFLEAARQRIDGGQMTNNYQRLAGRMEDVLAAVYSVFGSHLDAGAVRKIQEALPEELRNLWPTAQAA